MKSLTSVLGWTLLLAVLAVPSFLFYNWWSKSRQQVSAELTQTQDQPEHNIFPPADKSAAPAANSTTAARPAQQPLLDPTPSAQAAEQPAGKPAPAPAAQAQTQTSKSETPQAQAAPQDPAAAQAVHTSSSSSQAVQVSTQVKPVSYYTPKVDRDPTMSPDDYRRIKEADEARKEAEQQQLLAYRNRPKPLGPESKLHLQGIVGNAAIINGEMYSAGQTVLGIKIVKVGSNYIVGEFKGKTFRKVLK